MHRLLSTKRNAKKNNNTYVNTFKTMDMTRLILHSIWSGREVSIFSFFLFICLLEDGTNIDNWTLEDLTQCVKYYYAWIDQ